MFGVVALGWNTPPFWMMAFDLRRMNALGAAGSAVAVSPG